MAEDDTDVGGPGGAMLEVLFGDAPIEAWPPTAEHAGAEAEGPPWDGFVRARDHLEAGDQDLAVREWAAISMLPTQGAGAVEPRHVLQAWHFLRGAGIGPDASIARTVMGVVAQVAVDGGHDILAAYRDGSVRFFHHLGGGVVIEPDAAAATGPELPQRVGELLAAGEPMANHVSAWDGPRLPQLTPDHTRLTALTPGGLRYAQGPVEALQADPLAGAVFAAATNLFVAVVELR